MGLPNETSPLALGSTGGYEIEQSLRFAGGSSDYFSRSVSGLTTQGGISFWIKFHRNFPNVSGEDPIFAINTGFSFARNYDARWYYRPNSGGGGDTSWDYRKARDESAWYHVFLKFNSASSTSLYLNGVLVDTQAYSITTSGGTFWIGRDNGGTYYAQYYLAEFHAAFGESLDATDFGEFDDNGVWRPIQFTGSYGSDGFYLKFDPSATNGLNHDHSGNGNNFTNGGGFSTTGTGTDVLSDTPTTNWCTWNPINSSASISLTEGNLKFGQSSNDQVSIGTQSMTSGKYYWEIDKNSGENPEIGIIPDTASVSNQSTPSATTFNQIAFITNSSNTIRSGSGGNETVSGLSAQTGAGTIGVAVDMDDHKIWWSDTSGNWFNSGDPAAGTNEAKDFTGLDCANGCMPYIYMGTATSHTAIANFGQRDFAYTPPTGYKALNTSNLSAPSIKDGGKYFNTVLYTGNATGRTITGVGFQADFLWNKLRDTGSQDHLLYDTVRGIGSNGNYVRLRSNTATAEEDPATANQDLTAFTSDGFTIGTHAALNGNNQAYVTWLWKAGGSGSSNTDGTITSTVSANPTAGFSIVSYAGNNSASATVGHGLGVSPSLVIVKDRTTSNYVWMVKFAILGGNILELNGTGVANAPSSYSTGTIGTLSSTTFGFTTNNSLQAVNGTGQNYIAYCFSEVEGYSKFGSYTGNGSTNGPFIYCGFKPAYLLTKNTGSSNWLLLDVARGQYYNPIGYKNATKESLYANSAVTEASTGTGFEVDFLSNGFKMRSSVPGELNEGSSTHIFAAFAEHPFGGSGVSPATAR